MNPDAIWNEAIEAAARLCEVSAQEENEAGERIEAEEGVCERSDRAFFRRGALDEAVADIRALKRPADASSTAPTANPRQGKPATAEQLLAGMAPVRHYWPPDDALHAAVAGALGGVPPKTASEWQDGEEPVYAQEDGSPADALADILRLDGPGLAAVPVEWFPEPKPGDLLRVNADGSVEKVDGILDRLRGWLPW